MTSRSGQTGQSIDRIEITNPGFGYTVTPTITIRSQNVFGTGAAATAIIAEGTLSTPTITNPGASYGIVPNVTINPVGLDTNIGIGSTAQAIAIVNTLGQVASIRYSFAGIGYTATPTITIDPPARAGLATGNYMFKELSEEFLQEQQRLLLIGIVMIEYSKLQMLLEVDLHLVNQLLVLEQPCWVQILSTL